MLRWAMVVVGMLAAAPALAGEMTAEEARHFVTGKLFNYTCFEGTRGTGRVFADGSVVGSIQFQGSGPVRYAMLPANTLHVKGGSVCASLRGMPVEPCFNVSKLDSNSFRGSISGLGFAYCDFTRKHGHGRVNLAHSSRHENKPIALRPSLTADNN